MERSFFIPIPKKSNAKECSNYCTIALISYGSKIMLKILQDRLQQYMNLEFPNVQVGYRKDRGTRGQITNIHWIIEKAREFQKKTSASASLTMLQPLTRWITTNWKIFHKMETPDHLTCLLINLYVGQEATVRTMHGTMDWFKIRKGVKQGCILSPCLFNLYTEYIMQNVRMDEAQTGIDCRKKYQ